MQVVRGVIPKVAKRWVWSAYAGGRVSPSTRFVVRVQRGLDVRDGRMIKGP